MERGEGSAPRGRRGPDHGPGKERGGAIVDPFVFLSTYRIKEGRVEGFRKMTPEVVDLVETNEPRMIGMNMFFDEEGTRVSNLQIHPDAASMEFHMKVVAEHIAESFDYLEAESIQILGKISETVLEMIRRYNPDVPITVMPVHEAGFLRTSVR
jgi:hypothetical protein